MCVRGNISPAVTDRCGARAAPVTSVTHEAFVVLWEGGGFCYRSSLRLPKRLLTGKRPPAGSQPAAGVPPPINPPP